MTMRLRRVDGEVGWGEGESWMNEEYLRALNAIGKMSCVEDGTTVESRTTPTKNVSVLGG